MNKQTLFRLGQIGCEMKVKYAPRYNKSGVLFHPAGSRDVAELCRVIEMLYAEIGRLDRALEIHGQQRECL